jgi:hypothetical protein
MNEKNALSIEKEHKKLKRKVVLIVDYDEINVRVFSKILLKPLQKKFFFCKGFRKYGRNPASGCIG